jgi:hypothetical protein
MADMRWSEMWMRVVVVVVVVRERAVTKERLGVSGAAVVSSKAVSASCSRATSAAVRSAASKQERRAADETL